MKQNHLTKAYLAAITCAFLATSAQAQEGKAPTRTVHVTGSGVATAAPDEANISIAIVTQATTAAASTQENAQKADDVFKRLKNLGLDEKAISTSSYSVQPQYVYEKNNAPKLTAYQTQNAINVRIHDIKNIGKVLDTVLAADGANRVQGISFTRKDIEAQMVEARTNAMQNAIAKAKLYAAQAGATLGDVITISEQGAPQVYQPRMMDMQAMEARSAAPTPIAAGDLTWNAQVSVTFALK